MTEPVMCPCGTHGCCLTCPTLRHACPTDPCDEKQRNDKHRHTPPNHSDQPWRVCPHCTNRLTAIPDEIADAHQWLGWALLRPESGRRGDGRAASPDPALPFPADAHDLISPQPDIRHPDHLRAAAADQIGWLPVRATLTSWIRDWIDLRDQRENGPDNTVTAMARWLRERTGWACDHHPAIADYATELQQLRGALHGIVGQPEPDERPQHIPGVPCPRCRHVTLARRPDGWTECGWPDCASVFSPEDYDRVTRATARGALRTHRRLTDGTWVPREEATA